MLNGSFVTTAVSHSGGQALSKPGRRPAACAITKLGGTSAFVGKVGDDEFGRMLVDILEKNGVNISGVCYAMHARTALAFVTLKKDGERQFMFYRNPSADMMLKESDINMDMIKEAKIFHYGSISLITEPVKSAHLAAIKVAKEADSLFGLLLMQPGRGSEVYGIKQISSKLVMMRLSFSQTRVPTLMHDDLKLLLVTDGEKGCRYFTKSFRGRVAGYSVKAVDTTGAGDAFVGSLLVDIAQDPEIYQDEAKLKEALLFANACGALAQLRRELFQHFLHQRKPKP
ncbi:hypothetical protein Leryth_019727 [Lithospermum erythrorhizon]|nr:hypothetical protein Leryth_019727 [Lithospermum erythrorhizon]